ncbi:MAG: hypothetical protein LBI79_07990 [Nitrososphaerota archaeon]|jgi:putative NADPH-quinone reductase|nr:hypothetical protein [Nitrososphaerota archaeon]
MKRAKMFAAIAICLIIMVLAAILIVVNGVSIKNKSDQPFYVGVTYGGRSVQEAKELIDQVKNYTNLFILASGDLQHNITAINEIGDYSITSGLNFITYFGAYFGIGASEEWIEAAQQQWSNQFLGVYFYDEPGGKMLDTYVWLSSMQEYGNIQKTETGAIHVSNGTNTAYYPNGTITVDVTIEDRTKNGTLDIYYPNGCLKQRIITNLWLEEHYTEYPNGTIAIFNKPITTITYYPTGAITVFESPDAVFYTAVNGSARIAQVESLDTVLNRNPIKTYDEAAQAFESETSHRLQNLKTHSLTLFSSDYALYWWDFRSGYDVVLAELGWNNTLEQEIGLVRGAANLQGKRWGTILTWKYTQAPYLADGQEMFEQMKTSYETGAEYVIIFNYSEDPTNPNTLQDEHYQALERFWGAVVQNPSVVPGGIKAEAALVLPRNYGWGMRDPQDTIWGIWAANDTSQQIWAEVQSRLTQYGSKLDIVYNDPAYPATGQYSHIYYWDSSQTMFSGLTAFFASFYVWMLAAILLLSVAVGGVLFYFRRQKR